MIRMITLIVIGMFCGCFVAVVLNTTNQTLEKKADKAVKKLCKSLNLKIQDHDKSIKKLH